MDINPLDLPRLHYDGIIGKVQFRVAGEARSMCLLVDLGPVFLAHGYLTSEIFIFCYPEASDKWKMKSFIKNQPCIHHQCRQQK